jgi:hypothetical protein
LSFELCRYSRISVDVPRGTPVQWRFPQEKATFNGLAEGTVTLILLWPAFSGRATAKWKGRSLMRGDAAFSFAFKNLEHRAGFEPANTGFADLRVSHFATGA